MTGIPIYATLACCLISALVGYLAAVLGRRLFHRPSMAGSETESSSEAGQAKNEREIELLISSLYELTTHVDSQVGEHSLRVSEITNSLETPDEVGSTIALVAGKLLITANQKLQTDLEDAKKEIQRQRDQMSSCMLESRLDALTGLANRRALDHELIRVFADRRRTGSTFCMLILDIDHFKRVNDQYGHMIGDQLLKSFSRCMTNTFRESDFVARYGGEEFVAILPNTLMDEACEAAERIRNHLASIRHRVGDLDLQITASIGVKEVEDDETDAEFLQKADKALYAAKNAGRNCCFYHDGATPQRFVPTVKSVIPDPESELDPFERILLDVMPVAIGGHQRLTSQRVPEIV